MVSASSFSPPHMLPIATSRVFLKPAEGPPRRQESLVGRSGLPRILPQRRLQESGNKSTGKSRYKDSLTPRIPHAPLLSSDAGIDQNCLKTHLNPYDRLSRYRQT